MYTAKLQTCLNKDIKIWMTYNYLVLNSNKTKVIVFGLRNTLSSDIVSCDGIALACSSIIRNVRVIFGQDMPGNLYICYYFKAGLPILYYQAAPDSPVDPKHCRIITNRN